MSRHRWALVGVLAILQFGWITPASSKAAEDDRQPNQLPQWSMHMNGPRRLGRSPYIGPQTPNLLWRYETETNYGGPVIGRDGTVYMGTLDGVFLAFRPDGSLKWSISVSPRTVESTPAILPDGRIAFLDSGGTLYVVKPSGARSWKFATGVSCFCNAPTPAVAGDGSIYFGLLEDVYAIASDGSLKWTFHLPPGEGYRMGGPVSVSPAGVVYVPAKYLFALNPDGTIKWQSVDLFGPGGSPVIAADGTIYVNSYNPALWAFNPDGTVKWTYEVAACCAADVPATPAIGSDGTVYLGDLTEDTGVEVAVNPDGTLKWSFSMLGLSPTSAAIGADGTIYFGTGNGGTVDPSIYALNPDGSLKWQYDDVAYIRTPPAIGKGQRLYAGSFTGFFALGP